MPTINVANVVSGFDASSLTTRDVTTPSDAANRVVYIWFVLDGTGGSIASSGFAAVLDNIPIPAASTTARASLLRKEEGASPPSVYTVTSSSERGAWLCWAVDGDNGIDGTPPTPNTGDGSTATCPAATPSEAGTLVLRLVATDNTSLSHSTISGYTAIGSIEQASGGAVSAQYKELATAAALTAENVTLGVSEQWTAATVIILGTGGGGGSNGAAMYHHLRNLGAY